MGGRFRGILLYMLTRDHLILVFCDTKFPEFHIKNYLIWGFRLLPMEDTYSICMCILLDMFRSAFPINSDTCRF